MLALSLSSAARAMNATLQGSDHPIKRVVVDSREALPGDLFIALPGARVDGHNYLEQAAAKGAIGAVISVDVETRLPTIRVPNTVQALGQWAKIYRQTFQIPMVAITGSCGKTTVKEMLTSILSVKASVLSNQGNLNTEVGLPLTLLRLLPQHQFAVIEMGARKAGDIQYLVNLAKPSVSMITNAGVAHIEVFGSADNIAKAKGEIYEGLSSTGTAILNLDDPYFHYWKGLIQPTQRLMTFGLNAKANISAKKIVLKPSFVEFDLVTDVGTIGLHLPIPGQHTVQNALSAAAAARALDISLETIKIGLEAFRPVAGRMEFKKSQEGVLIIDDTYNANPISMRAAISVLAGSPGVKLLVMGDMFELGQEAATLHAEIGKMAKEMGIDRLMGVGALTLAATLEFGKGATHYSDKTQLIHDLKQELSEYETVLVKGSRGMKMEEVVLALINQEQGIKAC